MYFDVRHFNSETLTIKILRKIFTDPPAMIVRVTKWSRCQSTFLIKDSGTRQDVFPTTSKILLPARSCLLPTSKRNRYLWRLGLNFQIWKLAPQVCLLCGHTSKMNLLDLCDSFKNKGRTLIYFCVMAFFMSGAFALEVMTLSFRLLRSSLLPNFTLGGQSSINQ